MCFFIVHIECTCPSIPSSRHELQSMPVCVHTFPHTRVLDARLSFILLLTCCLLVCLFACFVCLLVFCVRVCFCCCLACCLPPCPQRDLSLPRYSSLTLSDRLPLAVQARYQFFLSNKIVCMKVCCQSI